MPRRQRDYRAEYAKRNDRARAKGFASYGVQRRQRAELRKLIESQEELTDVRDLLESPQGQYKHSRIEKLRKMGAHEDQVLSLYGATSEPGFWKLYRTEYERVKMA